eukprot:CAMPEP_0206462418 /NCGR_PEP_ID=MMETSP0324_2-20121206/25972_1 /ASSEMBLY_ACC=CAM_ASM_000836 /TAXON_ID=2866 /ORGANISM="Crypthecodinium cohnii, Strain Seligo" /LENGTH=310 /DNA_ID=CAMNT_0053934581 /DNA_START=699 /DNA_END=1631 /DNA_ORIENTATION=+
MADRGRADEVEGVVRELFVAAAAAAAPDIVAAEVAAVVAVAAFGGTATDPIIAALFCKAAVDLLFDALLVPLQLGRPPRLLFFKPLLRGLLARKAALRCLCLQALPGCCELLPSFLLLLVCILFLFQRLLRTPSHLLLNLPSCKLFHRLRRRPLNGTRLGSLLYVGTPQRLIVTTGGGVPIETKRGCSGCFAAGGEGGTEVVARPFAGDARPAGEGDGDEVGCEETVVKGVVPGATAAAPPPAVVGALAATTFKASPALDEDVEMLLVCSWLGPDLGVLTFVLAPTVLGPSPMDPTEQSRVMSPKVTNSE